MKKSAFILTPLLLLGCQPKHSPEAGKPPAEVAEKQASSAIPAPDSFIGLSLKAAEEKAEKADLPHRVIKKDGEDLPVTRDYRPERLNFTIENSVVTHVTNG